MGFPSQKNPMGWSMADAYEVGLSGRTVARLFAKGDHVWLEWDEGYWEEHNHPVLGLCFEHNRAGRVSSALRLPPWFSNLLPEGKLRAWVARDAGVNEQREMQLLAHLGGSLPGAVTVAPCDGAPTAAPPSPEPTSSSTTAQPIRFSLAGVALKFSMLQQGDRLTLPAHDTQGEWIVKLPDDTHPHVPENEYATMLMARDCGIEIPEIRLIHRDQLELPPSVWPARQEWAYAIRRFDREGQRRIHIEDLAQVRGFYPDDKYKGTFDTVAALIYRDRDIASYLEFVRRLFFSFAVGNGDMHLKNTSLIYRNPRNPVISPAYDLLCTAPYRDDPLSEDLGLKLSRSRRFAEVTPRSFELLADRVGAPVPETMQVVSETATRLEQAWSSFADLMAVLPTHQRWLAERLPRVSRQFA
ncbi:type II toxin-antitoxin system HipA family toxin [Tessaracoccus sp. OH4464_COT-324]|nr:type II toxin-antitoxin system HipA family toxin [Tessaracoccus sp. OH4464_COT-324]